MGRHLLLYLPDGRQLGVDPLRGGNHAVVLGGYVERDVPLGAHLRDKRGHGGRGANDLVYQFLEGRRGLGLRGLSFCGHNHGRLGV